MTFHPSAHSFGKVVDQHQHSIVTQRLREQLEGAIIQKHGWIENMAYLTVPELEALLDQPSQRQAM